MYKWNYNLGTNGVVLRDLINYGDSSQENYIAIVDQIIKCCRWLLTHLHEEDKEAYDWDLEDMIQECKDIKYDIDEYDEESINDVLDEFYNLMDEMRVWIGI